MAERLAGETAAGGRPPTLVVFELEPCITIGRLGSRADVALAADELAARRLAVRFAGRGGGAVLHGPGQVCVSLFAALEDLGLADRDVGGLVERFEHGLAAALRGLKAAAIRRPGAAGVFGRTGLLAAVGLAVRRGGVAHGGFVNVGPALDLHHRVTSQRLPTGQGAWQSVVMSSVEAEIQRRVRLQDARTAIAAALADSFGFEQPHVHSGFPLVPAALGSSALEHVARVG